MSDFREKANELLKKYLELDRKKKTTSLTEVEEELWGQLGVYFDDLARVYNKLSSSFNNLTDPEKELFDNSRDVIVEKEKYEINSINNKSLLSGITALKSDNVPAVGKLRLDLLMDEAIKRIDSVISKVGVDKFLDEYHALMSKSSLSSLEQEIYSEYRYLFECMEHIYNILKKKEMNNGLSDKEKKELVELENILSKNNKIMVSSFDNERLHTMMSVYQREGIPALGKLMLDLIVEELSKRGELSNENSWKK